MGKHLPERRPTDLGGKQQPWFAGQGSFNGTHVKQAAIVAGIFGGDFTLKIVHEMRVGFIFHDTCWFPSPVSLCYQRPMATLELSVQAGIIVVACSQCARGTVEIDKYAVGRAFADKGVRTLELGKREVLDNLWLMKVWRRGGFGCTNGFEIDLCEV